MKLLENWLAEDYDERHVEIELTCNDPHDARFCWAVTLTEFHYSGPPEPASTGDHSSSIVRHTGWGTDLCEAATQALAQRQAATEGS